MVGGLALFTVVISTQINIWLRMVGHGHIVRIKRI